MAGLFVVVALETSRAVIPGSGLRPARNDGGGFARNQPPVDMVSGGFTSAGIGET